MTARRLRRLSCSKPWPAAPQKSESYSTKKAYNSCTHCTEYTYTTCLWLQYLLHSHVHVVQYRYSSYGTGTYLHVARSKFSLQHNHCVHTHICCCIFMYELHELS